MAKRQIKSVKKTSQSLLQRLQQQNWRQYIKTTKQKIMERLQNLRKVSWREKGQKIIFQIRKINLLKLPKSKYVLRSYHWLSNFWKRALVMLSLFLLFYYVIGSHIAENIDVDTEYKISQQVSSDFEAIDTMSFLIKREIDAKMWTPNLPLLFPAYVLDNMPNFQIGVIAAVRDTACTIKEFEQKTELQAKEIKKACKFLSYSPKIWLMARQGAFNIAPSSNSQYRKAARELRKYSHDGKFELKVEDLEKLLRKNSVSLKKLIKENEEYTQEKADSWLSTEADDLFYYAKGYAFSLWQINKIIGVDFKAIILEKDLYADWTYLLSSLKKAAQLNPYIVSNGKVNNMLLQNHLIIQNYYLMRAAMVIEKMRQSLMRSCDDNSN